jgi:hypothetical protein
VAEETRILRDYKPSTTKTTPLPAPPPRHAPTTYHFGIQDFFRTATFTTLLAIFDLGGLLLLLCMHSIRKSITKLLRSLFGPDPRVQLLSTPSIITINNTNVMDRQGNLRAEAVDRFLPGGDLDLASYPDTLALPRFPLPSQACDPLTKAPSVQVNVMDNQRDAAPTDIPFPPQGQQAATAAAVAAAQGQQGHGQR